MLVGKQVIWRGEKRNERQEDKKKRKEKKRKEKKKKQSRLGRQQQLLRPLDVRHVKRRGQLVATAGQVVRR